MIRLKEVLYLSNGNCIEATWVQEVTPAIEVPEEIKPGSTMPEVLYEDGTIAFKGGKLPDTIIEAHTVPAVEVQIRNHTYQSCHDQIDEFERDAGDEAHLYADIIAKAHASVAEYVEPVITPDDIVLAMDRLFNQTARSKHYDDRISCAMRAGYPGPYQAEGLAFATWMDAQNAKAYGLLYKVQTGQMAMPTTIEAALALLDPMVWPS